MSEDLIKRSDAIGACSYETIECYEARKAIRALPPADRPQGQWIDKAISIIDDMQREGIIDYEQAWEFRMRARMKGADDEYDK